MLKTLNQLTPENAIMSDSDARVPRPECINDQRESLKAVENLQYSVSNLIAKIEDARIAELNLREELKQERSAKEEAIRNCNQNFLTIAEMQKDKDVLIEKYNNADANNCRLLKELNEWTQTPKTLRRIQMLRRDLEKAHETINARDETIQELSIENERLVEENTRVINDLNRPRVDGTAHEIIRLRAQLEDALKEINILAKDLEEAQARIEQECATVERYKRENECLAQDRDVLIEKVNAAIVAKAAKGFSERYPNMEKPYAEHRLDKAEFHVVQTMNKVTADRDELLKIQEDTERKDKLFDKLSRRLENTINENARLRAQLEQEYVKVERYKKERKRLTCKGKELDDIGNHFIVVERLNTLERNIRDIKAFLNI